MFHWGWLIILLFLKYIFCVVNIRLHRFGEEDAQGHRHGVPPWGAGTVGYGLKP